MCGFPRSCACAKLWIRTGYIQIPMFCLKFNLWNNICLPFVILTSFIHWCIPFTKKKLMLNLTIWLFSLEFAPPDTIPTDFTVANTDVTTVDLTWSVSQYTCDVLGYEIVTSTGTQEMTTFVEGGLVSEYKVEGLRPNTAFMFTLAARTVLVGSLEPSQPVMTTTLNFTGKLLIHTSWELHIPDSVILVL